MNNEVLDSIEVNIDKDVFNSSNKLINKDKVIKNHATTNDKIGINNRLKKEEKDKFIQEFIQEIFQRLEKCKKEDIFVIDRFEGDWAVCENRETREMVNIEINKLPNNIREGDVLKFEDNNYKLDETKKQEIQERINSKVQDLFED